MTNDCSLLVPVILMLMVEVCVCVCVFWNVSVLFIASISIFKSQRVVFIILCYFIIFPSISIGVCFISSLKASIIFIRLDLRSFSCASGVLGYPGLAVV